MINARGCIVVTTNLKFMHHFPWNVVGQVPVFMSELTQELVEHHAFWTSSQQLFLDDDIYRYHSVSTHHINLYADVS